MIIPADNMEGKNAEVVVGGVALIGVGGDEVGGNHTMTKIADVIEIQILGGTKVVDVDMLIRVIQGVVPPHPFPSRFCDINSHSQARD